LEITMSTTTIHPFSPAPHQTTRSFSRATFGFLASTLFTSVVMVALSAL
jgi:hypothetical protein